MKSSKMNATQIRKVQSITTPKLDEYEWIEVTNFDDLYNGRRVYIKGNRKEAPKKSMEQWIRERIETLDKAERYWHDRFDPLQEYNCRIQRLNLIGVLEDFKS